MLMAESDPENDLEAQEIVEGLFALALNPLRTRYRVARVLEEQKTLCRLLDGDDITVRNVILLCPEEHRSWLMQMSCRKNRMRARGVRWPDVVRKFSRMSSRSVRKYRLELKKKEVVAIDRIGPWRNFAIASTLAWECSRAVGVWC